MTFEYTPIILPPLISSIILLGVWIYTFKYRRESSARIFLGLITCLLIWSIGVIFEFAAVELAAKILIANIQFIGILFIPIFMLSITIAITGHGNRFVPFLRPLAVFAIISILIIWTNDLHHLYRVNPRIDTETASFPILVNDYGLWFYYVQIPIAYLSYLLNLIILVRALRYSEKTYRMQAGTLLLSIVLPLLTDGLYILGFSPIPNLNLTPVVFSISGLLLGWALFQYRLFDLGPLAYQLVIQNMQDGVIVLDLYERIVSLNPAAYQITKPTEEEALGQSITQIMPSWPTLDHNEVNIYTTHHRAPNDETEAESQYEILVSPIFNRTQKTIGRVITLRDVTQRVRLQQETQLLAATDSLTNVLNRRAFFEHMNDALQNAVESQSTLAFIMFDIDNLKEINDRLGHHFGDAALVNVAQICQANLRKGEVVGRYGGDEFCILLPQTKLAESQQIAVRLHRALSNFNIAPEKGNIALTISMGIVEVSGAENTSIEDILRLADQALYQAKEAGKNQTIALRLGED